MRHDNDNDAPLDHEVLSRLRHEPSAEVETKLRAHLRDLREKVESAKTGWRFLPRFVRSRTKPFGVAASAILVVVLATLLVILVITATSVLRETTLDRLAFARVLETTSRLESVHARYTKGSEDHQIWAERPNRLRVDLGEGRYEISVGPDLWVVDEIANEATKKPSHYYWAAQRRGVDVLEYILGVANDDLSGFFSERPAETLTIDGVEYYRYEMRVDSGQSVIHFEALVESESLLLRTAQLDIERGGELATIKLTVLERNPRIAASKFTFEKLEGMTVTVEAPEPAPEESPGGSTLTGRIVWSHSLAPVPGARVTVFGYGQAKSLRRVETDRDGIWKITGVRKGRRVVLVRSWELDWPAVPTFVNNVGTPEHPEINVDGTNTYSGLDFEVFRPGDFKATFATITARIRDEDGQPLERIGAYLMSFDEQTHFGHLDERGQFTGADGILEATRAIPNGQRMRIHLWRENDMETGYGPEFVYRAFTIATNKRRYDFDFVVPRTRRMTLGVQDPDGAPLPGVAVWITTADGHALVFPRIGSSDARFGITDGNGQIVMDVVPGLELAVNLKRLREGTENYWERGATIASAVHAVTVPETPESRSATVLLDERPIRIVGTVHVTSRKLQKLVSGTIGGSSGHNLMPACTGMIDDAGHFALEGVPAGRVRVQWWSATGASAGEGTIDTRPGETYHVQITDDGLQHVKE